MSRSLVIVESPAKSKTINKILGKRYTVLASMGHVRDLPKSRIGVDIEHGFEPTYIVPLKSRKTVTALKKAARGADAVYLAPDPDREGEAIAWHLQEALKGSAKRFLRVTFNEITTEAIRGAFAAPAEVDLKKVESQQARRILDRIVGYTLSPLLWKKVGRGLSAGRVQSVAVKLICDREAEIRAFTPTEYWTIEASLKKTAGGGGPFTARLAKIDGAKAEIPDGARAAAIVEDASKRPFSVASVEEKERRQRPSPPFITSTLQQAGVNRLHWPVAKTMKVAQQLYEGLDVGTKGTVGLITYMRTDSTRIAATAQEEALRFIRERYGDAYAPTKPNRYASRKGAQEAHEAIRPTSAGRTPEDLKPHLSREQHALYRLVWERFIASQMAPAVMKKVEVGVAAGPYLFRAADTKVVFDGYLKVAGAPPRDEEETPLPPLAPGEPLALVSLAPSQHFTKPPPRYTEATLIRALEENGIGRPSTYAPTIFTIRKRAYVGKEGGRLFPTPLGELVNGLLVRWFPELINVEFTARMEDELDEIESGTIPWTRVLREFYEPYTASLSKAQSGMETLKKAPEPTSAVCDCGHPMVIRHTLKGHFLACADFPRHRCIKRIEMREDGSFTILEPVVLDEKCPRCGRPLMERHGKYGPFTACSGYKAHCRYVKPDSTGIRCPMPGCGGEIIRKRGRGRSVFYGCSNYPDCAFRPKSLDGLEGAPKPPAEDGGRPERER
ncbi:MAG: type I DNA topoisomerase [Candidatus Aureabacteria bacterium]|nr:type I DNA topoisomerase [Candidatus Auribacterota bacterium]HOE26599.1 type I DNA topoisomerase [bacterium]HQM52160.1 type I DNA topoisomerase [bacterium]